MFKEDLLILFFLIIWNKECLGAKGNNVLRGSALLDRQVEHDRWDSLGFGVQPFDALYEHSKLRGRVLDLGEFHPYYPVRTRVSLDRLDTLRTEKLTEKGSDEFARKLMLDLKASLSIAGFKASVSSHYGFETTQHTDYFFSRTASIVERAHIRVVNPTISNLRSMVIPAVAKFLATSTPQQIFTTYGTHVTTGFAVGGALEMWSFSHESQFSSKQEFSRAASAKFKLLVNYSASLSAQESSLSSRVVSVQGLIVKGGNLNRGPNGEQEWIDSTAENAQEIAYLPNGAVPIWLLIPDGAQANRVRIWYERVFGKTAVILKRFSSPELSTVSRYAHPEAQVYVPEGWKVVSGGATVEFFGVGQLLTKSFPIVTDGRIVGWKVQSKDHLKSDPGKIQAHAIAIWDPFDTYDVVVRMKTSGVAQHPAVTVTLPTGYTRVGGGASTLFVKPGNMLVENYPLSERSWAVSSKDHLQAAPSRIEAYVIGLRLRDGGVLRATVKSLTFGPRQHPFGSLNATDGYGIIGGGAKVSRGGVGNMLVSLVPSSTGKSFYAYAKDHLRPDPQRLTIYAIEVQGAVFVDSIEQVLIHDPTSQDLCIVGSGGGCGFCRPTTDA